MFVSHDMNAVKTLCDSAILLDHGRVIDYDEPTDVVDFYQNMILKKMHTGDLPVKVSRKIPEKNENNSGISTGEVELLAFKLFNYNNEEISYIESEQILKIFFKVKTSKDLRDPHYGIILKNNYGISVFETNTYCMGIKNPSLKKDQVIMVTFEMKCPLAPGDYSISIGVAEKGVDQGSFHEYLLIIRDIEILKVLSNDKSILYSGVFNMQPTVTIQQ